jgi:hypothetical protein
MTPEPVDPALLERIGGALVSNLRPVRPLPATGVLVMGLVGAFLIIALAGAGAMGFFGLRHLTPGAIALIFPPLTGLALLAGAASVNEMIPGSKRPFHPAVLPAAGCLLMAAIFAAIFPDHRTDSFVLQGTICLKAGLAWAAPAAAGTCLLLRRGFAVNGGAAGVAIGTVAGLAGVTVLELHCPNPRMPHMVVWHLAVVPVAAVTGYIWGRLRESGRRRATHRP